MYAVLLISYVCNAVFVCFSTSMRCKRFLECLLSLLNLLLTVTGLAILLYGIYLYVVYKHATDHTLSVVPVAKDVHLVKLVRSMLTLFTFDKLPKAWYVQFSSSTLPKWLNYIHPFIIVYVFVQVLILVDRHRCCSLCGILLRVSCHFDKESILLVLCILHLTMFCLCPVSSRSVHHSIFLFLLCLFYPFIDPSMRSWWACWFWLSYYFQHTSTLTVPGRM